MLIKLWGTTHDIRTKVMLVVSNTGTAFVIDGKVLVITQLPSLE